MLDRHHIMPENTHKVGGNYKFLYTARSGSARRGRHPCICRPGRTARALNGDVEPKRDMCGQIQAVEVEAIMESERLRVLKK